MFLRLIILFYVISVSYGHDAQADVQSMCAQSISDEDSFVIDMGTSPEGHELFLGNNIDSSSSLVRRPMHFVEPLKRVISVWNEKYSPRLKAPTKVRFIYRGAQLPSPYSNFFAVFCRSNHSDAETITLHVSEGLFQNLYLYKKLFAHELFHWASHVSKRQFPRWMEEGLAQVFESDLTGVPLATGQMVTHLTHSPWLGLGVDLQDIAHDENLVASYYGHAVLFLNYIMGAQRERFIESVMLNPSRDVELVIEVAYSTSFGERASFSDLFKRFSVAKYVNFYNFNERDPEKAKKYLVLERVRTLNALAPDIEFENPLSSRIVGQGYHSKPVIYIPSGRTEFLRGQLPEEFPFPNALKLVITE